MAETSESVHGTALALASTLMNHNELLEVLREAKVLARKFYLLTGKPLGITGEVMYQGGMI